MGTKGWLEPLLCLAMQTALPLPDTMDELTDGLEVLIRQ